MRHRPTVPSDVTARILGRYRRPMCRSIKPLFANKKKLDVCLFEYSGRFGGRLLSVKVPGVNADEPDSKGVGESYAEFGGFRFARTMHIVWDTAKHLGLTDEPFNFDCNDNLVYVRGQHLT